MTEVTKETKASSTLANRHIKEENPDTKYVVYANDLKHKSTRSVNPHMADWDDDNVKERFGKDFDTITSRLKESKLNGFSQLDFSRLKLEKFPNLENYKHYNELTTKLQYLFLNDNKLTKCDDRIKPFANIEVLDISFNFITEITYLPKYLKEFVCHTNEITSLPDHQYITKIDCSSNKITKVGNYENLRDLICNDNKLIEIPSYECLKRLICKVNPIVKIGCQPSLTHLDCSSTNVLGHIGQFDILTNLICNHTKTTDISKFQKLETLEIMGCTMQIPFIRTLKCLMCEDYENLDISSRYKVEKEITEQKNSCILFC